MHVVCFDIDGTLVASDGFDGDLYAEAIRNVLGVEVESDWSQYENVSDSGILAEILTCFPDTDQRARLSQEVQTYFVNRTRQYVAENPDVVREVPGALVLVEAMCNLAHVRVCIATGGWAETAALKLREIGIDLDGLAMATGSDAIRRTDIMRLAESRATREIVSRRTYFGDGVWDQKAAAELGYEFVAVGGRVDSQVVFPDLQNIEAIFAKLGL